MSRVQGIEHQVAEAGIIPIMDTHIGNNHLTFDSLEERIWSKINKLRIDDCWEWQAATNKLGYGVVMYHGSGALAHRIVWLLENGDVPDGLCVLHTCDNPPCCNPEHLWLGTREDNNKDRAAKGRGGNNPALGEASHLSKLTNKNIEKIRMRFASGASVYRLATLYGVGWRHIYKIVNREIWKHV